MPRQKNISLAIALRQARRLIIFVIGMTVLAIGFAMLVTPGPAIIVIPTGLGILAIEFKWARKLVHRLREQLKQTRDPQGSDK